MSVEFIQEGNKLRKESQLFYEAQGLDPSIVPEFEIDSAANVAGSGQFDPRKESWQIKLFPEFEHQNHRLSEGNTANLSIINPEIRSNGIHETAHSYFEDSFSLYEIGKDVRRRLPEDFNEQTLQHIRAGVQDYLLSQNEDELQRNLEKARNGELSLDQLFGTDKLARESRMDYVRQTRGDNLAEKYQDYIGMAGIDETIARIMAFKFEGDNAPEHEQLYGNDRYSRVTETTSDLDFVYSIRKQTDVSNVRTQELVQYINDEGFAELLSLDERQVLDRFYNKLEN